MKTIKLTISELYANVTPDLPHFRAVKGEVKELEDGLANLILNRMPQPGGELYEPEEDEEVVTHVDIHPDVLRMCEDNDKKPLIEACKNLKLDTTGNKPDLAKRLIDKGITQRMLIEGITEDES